MKKALKKFVQLFIVIAVFATAAGAAPIDGLPSISFKHVPAEKKFSLEIDGLKETATILLRDVAGAILLRENTNEQVDFAKLYNLSNLPEGTYYLSVKTSQKEVVQPLSLTAKEVIVDTRQQREFYAPVINVTRNYVDVSLFNGRIADVEIRILDANSKAVFQDNLENVVVVQKRYRLDKMQWGHYTIQVTTPEAIHNKAFNVY